MSRPQSPLTQFILGFFVFVLVLVAIQSVFPRGGRLRAQEPMPPGPCRGTPIKVDFPYAGGMLDPWTCRVQCTDKQLRYILYADGQATQCQALPGCNDWGEDNGVTCTPPGASSQSSS